MAKWKMQQSRWERERERESDRKEEEQRWWKKMRSGENKRKDAQLQYSIFRASAHFRKHFTTFYNFLYFIRTEFIMHPSYFIEGNMQEVAKYWCHHVFCVLSSSTHPSVWTLGWPVPARQHPDRPGHRGCRAGWEEVEFHPLPPACCWTDCVSTPAATWTKHKKIHTGSWSCSLETQQILF